MLNGFRQADDSSVSTNNVFEPREKAAPTKVYKKSFKTI